MLNDNTPTVGVFGGKAYNCENAAERNDRRRLL